MRNLLWLSILGGLLIANLPAATIQYTVTPIGNSGSQFEYNYFIDPALLSPTNAINEAIDIQFDPNYYSNLVNPIATPTSDWTVFAFQPFPGSPGGPGDYYLQPNKNNPSVSGPFSIDFTYIGTQQKPTPGAQPFLVDLFNNGNPEGAVFSGTTSARVTDPPPVPEPRGVSISAIGMLLVCIGASVRRRAKRATV